ncbi:MAG: flagellar biosynthetic protein FliO [Planctomycetales bacterium]|nr:flagellar biosynthetic protein FliO [Planctomycetales bacterium]
MPRPAAMLIATAWIHFAVSANAQDDLAPLAFPPSETRRLDSSESVRARAGQTLARNILAPRSEVVPAGHQVPIAAVSSNELAPLKKPIATLDLPDAPAAGDKLPQSPVPGLGTVVGALCLVLGAFFLVAWLVRKSMPAAAATLPADVAEPLGRILLAPRHYAHLIRLGNKLLLVSLSQAGAETLAEVTDPVEVDRLSGICRQTHPHSSTNAFRQVFEQFATQKTPSGFLGEEASRPRELQDYPKVSPERPHA